MMIESITLSRTDGQMESAVLVGRTINSDTLYRIILVFQCSAYHIRVIPLIKK
jgi:hypothetical protein